MTASPQRETLSFLLAGLFWVGALVVAPIGLGYAAAAVWRFLRPFLL